MIIPENAARVPTTVQGISLQNPVLFPDGCLDTSADFFASVGVLPNVAASILQSVLVSENPRNNIAQAVKDKVYGPALIALGYILEDEEGNQFPDWASAGSPKETLKELEDDVKAQLAKTLDKELAQKILDAYLVDYIPGQPRRSSGPVEVIDPVENQARILAKDALAARMSQQSFEWEGVRHNGVSLSIRANSYKAADAKMQAEKEISLADWIEQKITDAVENRPYFMEQAQRMLDEAAEAAGKLDSDDLF